MQLLGLRQDRLDWDGWNVAEAIVRCVPGSRIKAIVDVSGACPDVPSRSG